LCPAETAVFLSQGYKLASSILQIEQSINELLFTADFIQIPAGIQFSTIVASMEGQLSVISKADQTWNFGSSQIVNGGVTNGLSCPLLTSLP